MGWTDVAAESDLAERKPVRVAMDGSAVLVLRTEDQVFAVGNQCTHQGAGLDRGVVKIAGSVRTTRTSCRYQLRVQW